MENQLDNYRILYEENAKVAQTFWEWRHKILIRFFMSIAAIFVFAGWMYKMKEFQKYIFVSFLIGAIYSYISKRMDNVNTWILKSCYRVGMELEQYIWGKSSIFGKIEEGYGPKGSYGKLLKILYLSSSLILLFLSILSFWIFTIL
jgi:hypothetical protein